MSTIRTRSKKSPNEESVGTSTEKNTCPDNTTLPENTTCSENTTCPESITGPENTTCTEATALAATEKKTTGSRSSISRRAQLQARLELERAEAEAALARTKLELLRLDADHSDLSDEDNEPVSEWIERSPPPQQSTKGTGPGENNGLCELTSALIAAINGSKENTMKAPPRYISELPYFDGNPRDWIAFTATYKDTKSYFSEIENIARLRKSLQGQAREAVRSLLYTNTNTVEILETLERRFGRPTHLVKSEVALLERIPPMSHDIKGIGVFATSVSNSVNAIRQMNRVDYLYSNDIAEKIIDKMNMLVKFRWYEYRSTREEEPVLVALSKFLNTIADQFGTYDTQSSPRVKSEPFRRPLRNAKVHVAKHNKFSSAESGSDDSDNDEFEIEKNIVLSAIRKEKKKCLLCKSEHELDGCAQFTKESVEQRWVIVKKLKVCFKCLKTNHRNQECRSKRCGKDGCSRNHHALLHATIEENTEQNKIVSVNHVGTSRAYLKIVPVELRGPNGTATVSALLDEGSTVTLLLEEVADQLGATGSRHDLSIEGVSGHKIETEQSRFLKLQIRGMFGREYAHMKAYTIQQLNLASQSIRMEDIENCPHLADIEDQLLYEETRPSLLIGQDNWHLIVSRELKTGESTRPVASFTQLGWILHGCKTDATKPVLFINHIRRSNESEIENLIKSHFELDSLGIAPKKPINDPEQRALMLLENTTRRLPEGKFECGLLWRSDNETLPSNRNSAVRRLAGIMKKLAKDERFKAKYTEQIENLLKSGYAELVNSHPTSTRTWYLPHFAVVHPQKQKMRLVFDAAERTNGKSLNDALLPGPDLLQSLFGVLIRFRQGPIAIAADIKEMFLRVQIRDEDRDSLRFLWKNDSDTEPREYRMKTLIFGATSSPCSAIYIKNRNAKDFEIKYPEAVHAIERCHYMDDYLQSFTSEEDAERTSREVDLIHKNGGFELRGWASNNSTVLKDFRDIETENVQLVKHDQLEKTLGMLWHTQSDTLRYTLNLRNTPVEVVQEKRPPSKREVMSAVMSVFDPLGLATPILIQGKALIQQLWRTGIDWDDHIPEALSKPWSEWLNSLNDLQELGIPRCTYSYGEGELHTFVDASESIYAAATYWRTHQNGHTKVTLLAAKAKVAPLKPISIPRLELQAALLGSRLASSVQKELEATVTHRFFWSDSRTVLAWIKAKPRSFKAFVAHRLAEIEDATKVTEWRYIPTALNVADDATRNPPQNFNVRHRWFNGPEFLIHAPSQWPPDGSESLPPPPPTGEERCLTIHETLQDRIETPDANRFSSWKRLLRATGRVIQCVDIFKSLLTKRGNVSAIKRTVKEEAWRKHAHKKHSRLPNDIATIKKTLIIPLPVDYLHKAERLLVKRIQNDSFSKELSRLRNNKEITKQSRLKRFTVVLDDNILCLETRLSAARCVESAYKRPIVLDGRHTITQLLIDQYHRDHNHGNHNTVLNEIRQKYYVTSLRSTLKKISRSCQWCKIHRAMPDTAPLGDLPPERLQQGKFPFTCTAVDYFGPLSVTVGRRTEKRWVALYTCLTTRAVHLEMATSLSADSMLLTLRRMIARRGTPKTIYSDNGTNFVGANKELRKEFEKMTEKATQRGIKWKFIPPGAPHMGGAWERLVRSVKIALSATLATRHPREEILLTLLLEAEHLINSRPLTDVSMEPEEEESLTPNHFLIGRSSGTQRFGEFNDHELIGSATWKTVQRLTDHFWKRWLREYLPTIAPRYGTGQRHYANPSIGDIVLIVDSTLPRGLWPRGEIITVHPGPDSKIRIVEVRTAAGILKRSTSKLVVISKSPSAASS